MSGASATGGSGNRVGYYEYVATKKKESTINYKLLDHKPRRIPSSKIEPAVCEEVKKFVLTDDFPEIFYLERKPCKELTKRNPSL